MVTIAWVWLVKPTALSIGIFLFLIALTSHFVLRIFIPWKPNWLSHFLLLYIPFIESYLLFLGWQKIFEPILFLPVILVIAVCELCLRTLGV